MRLERTAIVNELSDQFRHAMRAFAATVNVITCESAEGACGMTVTAVTSLSADPPSLLACINVLSRDQAVQTEIFASRRRAAERFVAGDWVLGELAPYLKSAQANIFCRVVQTVHYATHAIFIGEVQKIRRADGIDPLIYVDGGTAGVAKLSS
jgi:flavin reductase